MTAQASNGGGPVRLTPQQTQALIEQARGSLVTIVGPDGQPLSTVAQVPVSAPQPASPAAVSLPVEWTAAELEVQAEGEATAFAIQLEHQHTRRDLEVELEEERGTLATCWRVRDVSQLELDRERTEQEAFLSSLPRRVRRVLGRRWWRAAKAVPWAMWAADTAMLSRPYGLFGPLPLPFSASVADTNVTQIGRAAAVSFGLTFGVRLLGAKLRDLVEELRERHASLGLLADAAVGALVFVGAIRLAESAAKIQQVLLQLEAGGSNLQLPTSVLFSIVFFLASVSLACGYYLSEPEVEQAREHERRLDEAKAACDQAVEACHSQLGVVRATRARLRSLEQEETLALAENQAHTDRRIRALQGGNVILYGPQPPLTRPAAASGGSS